MTTVSDRSRLLLNRKVEYEETTGRSALPVFLGAGRPHPAGHRGAAVVGDATVNDAAPYDVTVQAVSKHLKVLEDAGLVSRSREAQRRPVHLEANVFDLMTKWIERYRRQAEERYRRLDDVLRAMPDAPVPAPFPQEGIRHDQHHAPRGPDHRRPDVPLIRIVREFDAPPEKVFRAHTDPELVAQWMGPNGMQNRIDEDCRNGGSWRYVAVRDGEEYGFRGCFHEVRPNELIVQTFTFEGMPTASPWRSSCSRTSATAARGSRRRPWSTPSRADGFLASGWTSASTRATRSSTSCSPGADVPSPRS